MAKKKDILVQGKKITLISSEGDYLSLTDIDAAFDGGGSHIENWMRNRNTVEFLGVWESVHNSDFNSVGFDGIFAQTGLNRFKLSVKKWTSEQTLSGLKLKRAVTAGLMLIPKVRQMLLEEKRLFVPDALYSTPRLSNWPSRLTLVFWSL